MAGIWSRKFDYKNGEDRICKHCNASFHTIKPRYSCNICLNAKQKLIETVKRARTPKKENYPFDNKGTEASNRFSSIRSALSKAWKEYNKTGDKSYVIGHYEKQLKEAKELGILEWIYDRRTPEAKRENGQYVRTRNMIRKEYPDTRGHYED